MAKVGDIVRFLNSTGGGRIVKIENGIAHVEDQDGFEVPALLRECVVVADASTATVTTTASKSQPKEQVKTPEPELPKIETDHGEKINVVMAFEASNLKSLSNSEFDAVLVNDSNYFLNFSFATRTEEDKQWKLRRAGIIEPNIVLSMCTIKSSELNGIDRALLQFIAYKDDKAYEMKSPVSVETKIDNTKFFKFHCYKNNPYFDEPVIAIDIVKDDCTSTPFEIDAKEIKEAMREKNQSSNPPRKISKSSRIAKNDIIEVDLHINELLDNTKVMSTADILNYQIDEFRKVMDANLHRHGQRIVFIHGKGEGVLRNALLKELNHRYKGHDVSDASFREYGFGATQVVIR